MKTMKTMKNNFNTTIIITIIITIMVLSFTSCTNNINNKNEEKMIKPEIFEELINNGKPTIVDFYADWCAPCKIQGPIINELEEEMKDLVNIIKVNVDHNSEIAEKFSVVSIPTIVILNEGKKVWKEVGIQQKETLKNAVNSYL